MVGSGAPFLSPRSADSRSSTASRPISAFERTAALAVETQWGDRHADTRRLLQVRIHFGHQDNEALKRRQSLNRRHTPRQDFRPVRVSRVYSAAAQERAPEKDQRRNHRCVRVHTAADTALPAHSLHHSPALCEEAWRVFENFWEGFTHLCATKMQPLMELPSAPLTEFRYWYATDTEAAKGSPGWPLLIPSPGTRVYFLTQAGFRLSWAIHFDKKKRHKDFVEVTRRLVMFVFVVLSYTSSFWRPGLVSSTVRNAESSSLRAFPLC